MSSFLTYLEISSFLTVLTNIFSIISSAEKVADSNSSCAKGYIYILYFMEGWGWKQNAQKQIMYNNKPPKHNIQSIKPKTYLRFQNVQSNEKHK